MTDTTIEAVLAMADRGWSIIPAAHLEGGDAHSARCSCRRGRLCHSPGKHPRGPWKRWTQERASAAQLREWWERWPRANVAIVTGAISGLTVIDLDGLAGEVTWSLSPWGSGGRLPSAEMRIEDLDAASNLEHWGPMAFTGDGTHLYYTAPGSPLPNRQGFLPGVDVRSENGIVIAPPSVHVRGRLYRWGTDSHRDPARMPGSLASAIAGVGQ